MKYVARLLSLFILVSAGIFYASCDGSDDPEKSQEETQLDKLKGTWNVQSVVNDATTRTDEYPGMTVAIAGTFTEGGTYNYTSDATSWPSVSPWKALDTWKFNAGSVGSVLVRQTDLVPITYTLSNSDKTLELRFDYSGPGFNNTRVESVTGEWIFTFTKP
ncbi:MAG TPA: hypothetical protein VK589_29695 [Chryseolinea sp.]|nr:hypothetical protein [Chryseolinea sp.]